MVNNFKLHASSIYHSLSKTIQAQKIKYTAATVRENCDSTQMTKISSSMMRKLLYLVFYCGIVGIVGKQVILE